MLRTVIFQSQMFCSGAPKLVPARRRLEWPQHLNKVKNFLYLMYTFSTELHETTISAFSYDDCMQELKATGTVSHCLSKGCQHCCKPRWWGFNQPGFLWDWRDQRSATWDWTNWRAKSSRKLLPHQMHQRELVSILFYYQKMTERCQLPSYVVLHLFHWTQ